MPSTRGTPSIEETQAAASVLFTNFCRERFRLDDPDINEHFEQVLPSNLHGFEDGYTNALMASIGSDLRRIAEQVEQSNERERIRRRASEIDIHEVKYDQFRQLLNELFTNGINRTRIVVLFFFCTDVALRAYHSYPTEYCCRLLKWSVRFILDTICEWVQKHGGWGAVLGTYVYKCVVTSVMVLVGISCAIYIKKNIWPPAS